MADIEILIQKLDQARSGLNTARNAADQWRRGSVGGMDLTQAQKAALKAVFQAGLQTGKDGIAAVEAELGS